MPFASASPSDWSPMPKHVPLTPREREVFRLVAQGATVPETAAALGVSANTVKTHVKSAYAKLDIRTRAAAAHTARRLGLVPEPARR